MPNLRRGWISGMGKTHFSYQALSVGVCGKLESFFWYLLFSNLLYCTYVYNSGPRWNFRRYSFGRNPVCLIKTLRKELPSS